MMTLNVTNRFDLKLLCQTTNQTNRICTVKSATFTCRSVIQLLAARLKDAHSPAMRVPVAIDMTTSRAARSGAL